MAGAALTGTLGPQAAGLSAASVCLYWAGMSANDWADRDLDAKERPERPIPSGRVTPGYRVRHRRDAHRRRARPGRPGRQAAGRWL